MISKIIAFVSVIVAWALSLVVAGGGVGVYLVAMMHKDLSERPKHYKDEWRRHCRPKNEEEES